MTAETPPPSLAKFYFNVLLSAIFFPAVTLIAAGNWRWVAGWLFGVWCDAMVISSMVYLYRHDPALLAERSKAPGGDNTQPWDKYMLTGTYILALSWFIIMPLDAQRFGWSPPFPLGLKVFGGLALLPALYFIYQATVENTFLSTRVRIQDERGQYVITTGVYRLVRHPLYLGCVLMILGGPLLLGSIAGLLIGMIGIIALVFRIMGEEKMLAAELEGYTDYQQKVTYRLIPFVW